MMDTGGNTSRGTVPAVFVAAVLAAALHLLGFTNLGVLAAGIVAPVFGAVAASRGASRGGP